MSSELASNLDKVNGGFGFHRAKADGTGISSIDAVLTGLLVTAVPERSCPAQLPGAAGPGPG